MRRVIFTASFMFLSFSLQAAELTVDVTTVDGDSIENAVVYAVPEGGIKYKKSKKKIIIDQVDKEFVNHVTAIRTGTAVTFPNKDQIRHHVYSFSSAKQFEIPLYKGTPAKPIVFNKPGVVVLGCNIHDWMSAYIFVSDTPYFSVSDKSGKASLKNLPAGKYKIEVWHPRLKGKPGTTQKNINIVRAKNSLLIKIEQRRAWGVRRAPSFSGGGYR